MSISHKIPNWLCFDFWSVITVGELYPQIRAIAVSYSVESKIIFARFYLDRDPTEFDKESINEILSYLAGRYGDQSKVSKILDECVFSNAPIKDLDALGGFVYTRREYEMQDNPTQAPDYI
ncbi:MAG: hypothetical protein ABJJ43_00185 [Ekhidna sp.]